MDNPRDLWKTQRDLWKTRGTWQDITQGTCGKPKGPMEKPRNLWKTRGTPRFQLFKALMLLCLSVGDMAIMIGSPPPHLILPGLPAVPIHGRLMYWICCLTNENKLAYHDHRHATDTCTRSFTHHPFKDVCPLNSGGPPVQCERIPGHMEALTGKGIAEILTGERGSRVSDVGGGPLCYPNAW